VTEGCATIERPMESDPEAEVTSL